MIREGVEVQVNGDKKSKKGVVVYSNESFVTVQFKHYKESFLRVDIRNGQVSIKKLSKADGGARFEF